MTTSDVIAPLVVREFDDAELTYLESVEHLLFDGLDCLWGEEYEGWDARGHRFEARRHYPTRRWWERLLARRPNYLVITLVEPTPSPIIGSILALDLGLPPTDPAQPSSVRRLIQLGLDRQAAQAAQPAVRVPTLGSRWRWSSWRQ